jgi:hypothetical protein
MKVIEKLSDSGGFLVEAIRCVLINTPGEMSIEVLQWKLFNLGVFVKPQLLAQAVAVLTETDKRIKRTNRAPEKKDTQEGTQGSAAQAVSESGVQRPESGNSFQG